MLKKYFSSSLVYAVSRFKLDHTIRYRVHAISNYDNIVRNWKKKPGTQNKIIRHMKEK